MLDGSVDWFLVHWGRYMMPDLGGLPVFSKVIIIDGSKIMDLSGKLFFFFNKTRVKMLQFLKFKYILKNLQTIHVF